MRVLVVCSGNICRSPMAEGLLRHRLRGKEAREMAVSSAGTLGLEGSPADPDAVAAAAEAGFDISSHRSRGLTPEAVRQSDLVLVMTEEHAREVTRMAPGSPPVRLLGAYLPAPHRVSEGREIRDPLGGGPAAFRACLRRMERAVEGFLEQWRSGSVEEGPPGPPGARGPSAVEDAEQRYFRQVEERILQARGGGAGLSSMEFHVVDGWWKRHVPLWLVMEALDEATAAWAPGEAPRGLIRKADAEVEARAGEAGLARPGEPGAEPRHSFPGDRESLETALETARRRLGEAHPEIGSALREILDGLRPPGEAAAAPESLRKARERLCEAARASLPMGALPAIESEERHRLAALAERLSPEARRDALRRLIEERVLDWFDLPAMWPGAGG